jgi:hypothetical protein
MGIDIYARWEGMSRDEIAAQACGFSIAHGYSGYLREAYHGAPYATRVLVPEAFFYHEGATIPAALLQKRLPTALKVAEEREAKLYRSPRHQVEIVLKSFRDFVSLCSLREAETGKPCCIIASW